MRRMDARGVVLLDLLAALAVIAILAGIVLPLGRTLYARAAVEYEAMRLIGELRRVQSLSRTTATQLYVNGVWLEERAPRLYLREGGYVIHRPFMEERHTYRPLPLVRIEQETQRDTPVAFDRNGNIDGYWSHNMTIRVYAAGYEKDAVRVVIDVVGRIRLQRGRG